MIIVASVSCIYGLGSPEEYRRSGAVACAWAWRRPRTTMLRKLIDIQYARNDMDFKRGTFRVRGDVVEIFPVSTRSSAIRVEFFGDEIDRDHRDQPADRRDASASANRSSSIPASHFVTPEETAEAALENIERGAGRAAGRAARPGQAAGSAAAASSGRRYDLEMMQEIGYCSGIENYSGTSDGREPGETPYTLIDYFPEGLSADHRRVARDAAADRARCTTATARARKCSSSTASACLGAGQPAAEVRGVRAEGRTRWSSSRRRRAVRAGEHGAEVVEQIIRPTGLVDPEIDVRPTKGQIDDLLGEIRERIASGTSACW